MKFEDEGTRRTRNVTITWPVFEPAGSEPEPPLPSAYERTALYLLVRDPQSLFAFWSLNPEILAAVEPHQSKILRIYEVIDSKVTYTQYGIGNARTWYCTNIKPDTTYYGELGLLQPDGKFTLLARSNQIHSPRNSFSTVIDEEWLTIDELYGSSVGLTEMTDSEELLRAAGMHLEQQLGSESVSSFSSPFGAYGQIQPEPEPQDLILETTTFITIHGKTTPSALLSLNGQPIIPDQAGQFVYSLPLPEGELKMQIYAASPDQRVNKAQQLTITCQTR